MGEYNNRYIGGMNKESQIRSNSFHSHVDTHHFSVDTNQIQQQEAVSSANASAAQTTSISTATSTAGATASSATISTSAAVAGGTAAAVATAAVVVVASAFVPTLSDFEYESTANTLSYSFALSYQSGTSGVVKLENRFEKYEEFFELESYFFEEEMRDEPIDKEEGYIEFEEGMFTGLTPSTAYRLTVTVLDGETSYNVFSQKVWTTDVMPTDFVITADFALNEETQCLDGKISIEDPYGYYEAGSLEAKIVGDFASYPETIESSGNPYREPYSDDEPIDIDPDGEGYLDREEDYEKVTRIYEVADLSATQSFYVGGMDGGDNGLTLTISARSTYGGEPSSQVYFEKNYSFVPPIPTYTINFYNEDGTELLYTQIAEYGDEVVYKGEPDLEAIAESRTVGETICTFLGWAMTVGGEPYDTLYYAYNDQDYYAVFSEETKTYTITFYNEDGTVILAEQTGVLGDRIMYPYSDEPYKEPTEESEFFFAGWVEEIGSEEMPMEALGFIEGDDEYYAFFEEGPRYYTVTYYDYDGSVIGSVDAPYGESVNFYSCEDTGGFDFYREADADGCYSFNGFYDSDGNSLNEETEIIVTGDTSLYASYVVTSLSAHVIFLDEDGTVLQDDYQMAYYGVTFNDYEPPTKYDPDAEPEEQYRYFMGWYCEETGETLMTGDLEEYNLEPYANSTITFVATYSASV